MPKRKNLPIPGTLGKKVQRIDRKEGDKVNEFVKDARGALAEDETTGVINAASLFQD